MVEALQKVLSEYLAEKKKPFKNNSLGNYIRREAPEIIQRALIVNFLRFYTSS